MFFAVAPSQSASANVRAFAKGNIAVDIKPPPVFHRNGPIVRYIVTCLVNSTNGVTLEQQKNCGMKNVSAAEAHALLTSADGVEENSVVNVFVRVCIREELSLCSSESSPIVVRTPEGGI